MALQHKRRYWAAGHSVCMCPVGVVGWLILDTDCNGAALASVGVLISLSCVLASKCNNKSSLTASDQLDSTDSCGVLWPQLQHAAVRAHQCTLRNHAIACNHSTKTRTCRQRSVMHNCMRAVCNSSPTSQHHFHRSKLRQWMYHLGHSIPRPSSSTTCAALRRLLL